METTEPSGRKITVRELDVPWSMAIKYFISTLSGVNWTVLEKISQTRLKLCHNCWLCFSNGREITPKQMHRKWFAVQMTGPRLIEQGQPFRVVQV
jgi:hypothetical protein